VIYDFPAITEPIRQGDIFVSLPRIDLSLNEIPVIADDGQEIRNWADIAAAGQPVTALLAIRPVTAIVITQDCDNTNGRDISLCEIRNFREVERLAINTKNPKGWMSIITKHARVNLKWFYLPPDSRVGFEDKMGVDFTVTLRVPKLELEELRSLRRACLNDVADEHFRERLSEFYRRYPYDEWYPLNSEEFSEYQRIYPETKPFLWQGEASLDIENPESPGGEPHSIHPSFSPSE
jgi:hypothetical protein